MTNWWALRNYLPGDWCEALESLPPGTGERVQELRLRSDQPIFLSLPEGNRPLGTPPIVCSRMQLQTCFLRFCQQAVYAHEWELSQGFLSVSGGMRVGVAGTAVMEGERVRTVRDVTALCVRFPRRMEGCSRPLLGLVTAAGYPVSTLLVGPPSSGKTTLLRDLATELAGRYRVTVVDERGELSGVDRLSGCDVLLGYPKAVGVRQAVRCLAPEAVLFDELGGGDEVMAVADCAKAGVAVVATLHGSTPEELACQPMVRDLVARQAFSRWVFLSDRHTPGRIAGCYRGEVRPHGVRWICVDSAGRGRPGVLVGTSADPSGTVSGSGGDSVAGGGTADGVFRPADGGHLDSPGGYRRFV